MGWTPPSDQVEDVIDVAPVKSGWTPHADKVESVDQPDTTPIPTVTLNVNEAEQGLKQPKPRDYYAPLSTEIGHDKYTPAQRSLILKTADTFEKNPLYRNHFEGDTDYRETYFNSLGKSGAVKPEDIELVKQGVYDELSHRKSTVGQIAGASTEAVKQGSSSLNDFATDLTAGGIAQTIGEGQAKGENAASVTADVITKPLKDLTHAAFGLAGALPEGAVIYDAAKAVEKFGGEKGEMLNKALMSYATTISGVTPDSPEWKQTLATLGDAAAAIVFGGAIHAYGKESGLAFQEKPVAEIVDKLKEKTPQQLQELSNSVATPQIIPDLVKKQNLESDIAKTDPNSPAAAILIEEHAKLSDNINAAKQTIADSHANTDLKDAGLDFLNQTKEKLIASKEGLSPEGAAKIDEQIGKIDEQIKASSPEQTVAEPAITPATEALKQSGYGYEIKNGEISYTKDGMTVGKGAVPEEVRQNIDDIIKAESPPASAGEITPEQNATKIRSNQETGNQEGNVNQVSGDQSGQDLQRDTQTGTETGNAGNEVNPPEQPPTEPVSSFEKSVRDKAAKLKELNKKYKISGTNETGPEKMGGGINGDKIIDFVADAIIAAQKAGKNVLDYIREADWYKGLPTKGKAFAEQVAAEQFGKESGLIGMTRKILSQEAIEKNLTSDEKLFVSNSNPQTWNNVVDKITEDPNLPTIRQQEIFSEVADGERPKVSDEDALIQLYEKARLENEHRSITNEINDAMETGDETKRASLLASREAIENMQDDTRKTIFVIGSTYGKGLGTMQFLTDKDFSYNKLTNDATAEKGSPLTPAEEKRYKDMADEMASLKQQLKDIQAKKDTNSAIETRKNAEQRQKEDAALVEKTRKEIGLENKKAQATQRTAQKVIYGKKLIAEGLDELVRAIGAKTNIIGEVRPDAAKAFKKIGEGLIKAGEATLENVAEKIKDYINKNLKGKINFDDYSDSVVKNIKDAFDENKVKPSFSDLADQAKSQSGGEFNDGIKGIVQRMFKSAVEENDNLRVNKKTGTVDDYKEAVDKIHDALSKEIPDLNRQQVADMVSGYGDYKKLKPDEVSKALREIKAQEQADAVLKATEENKLPLHSGSERHKQSQQVREKRAIAYKNIKDKGLEPPLTAAQQASAFKTAEQKYQQTLSNSIEDLQKEIDTGIKRDRSTGKKEYASPETKELQRRKAELEKIRDAKFQEPPKTEGQKQINSLRKKIDDILEGKDNSGENKEPLTDAERESVKKLQEELKDAKEKMGLTPAKELPKVPKTAEETRLENLQNKLDDLLEGKIKDKTDKLPDSQEVKDLKEQINQAEINLGLKAAKELPKVPKTAEETRLENLQNKLDDLLEGKIKDKTDKLPDSQEVKDLKEQINQAEINLGLKAAKETPESAKIKATENAIAKNEEIIKNLKDGKTPDGKTPTVSTKGGKNTFGFKKDKNGNITSPEIRSLEDFNQNLRGEISDLMPEETKKHAIIDKVRKQRELRKKNLEAQVELGKKDPNAAYGKKEPKPENPFDKETEDINRKIKLLENENESAKEKFRRDNRGKVEKAIDIAGHITRFSIFLDPRGMLRLSYAAAFRPLVHPLTEIAKLGLSNIPGSKNIMAKSPGMYRPTIGSAVRATKNYYISLVSKSTLKSALSEFKKRSDYSLKFDNKQHDRYFNKAERVAVLPEQLHGAMKAFPKIASHVSTYKAALENLSKQIDPRTGKLYDITDPTVQQIAIEEAVREGAATVFMQNAEVSAATNEFIKKMSSSRNFALQITGLYAKTLQPVLKVPPNFLHEVVDQVPIIGLLDAAQVVARSGEKGAVLGKTRGVKNLTPDQAHSAARALVNQAVGLMILSAGIAYYKSRGEKGMEEVDKYHYWLHNTGFPIFTQGMQMGKEIHSLGDVAPSTLKQSASTLVKESYKMPQIKASQQVAELSFAAIRAAVGKTAWDKVGDKGKAMLARILVPGASAFIAEKIDNEIERDPKTFAELLKARIPGLREQVMRSKKHKHFHL